VNAGFALAWLSRARKLAAASMVGLIPLSCGVFSGGSEAFAQHPAPSTQPTQAVTCATCHVGVAASYATAPMRHALESPGANPALESHPNLSVQMGSYTYNVQTKDGKSTYSVSDGTDTMTLPIRWMFGQHSQTWVLEKDGHLYESLVSYFPREQVLATTPGDKKIVPHTVMEAMGRPLPFWESRSCFNCHATNAVAGQKLTLDKLTPGLGCERCHEGALQHLTDAANGNFKTRPKSLKLMNAEDVSNFCGQCHRTWDTVVRNNWKGPAFVRFQPYRLNNSKCFIGNDPRISCLACHDPHKPVNHNLSFYDSKCLACHGDAHVSTASVSTTPVIKQCPVAKTNCVSCHMPKVDRPGDHQSFTDHLIRIVRTGEDYPD
jgi:Cytochrome c554 and c-prime